MPRSIFKPVDGSGRAELAFSASIFAFWPLPAWKSLEALINGRLEEPRQQAGSSWRFAS